jgi:hypothetical protein
MAYQYADFYYCSGGTMQTLQVRVDIGAEYYTQEGNLGDCYVEEKSRQIFAEYRWAGGSALSIPVTVRLQYTFNQTYTGHPPSTYTSYTLITIPAGQKYLMDDFFTYGKYTCPCQGEGYDYPVPV